MTYTKLIDALQREAKNDGIEDRRMSDSTREAKTMLQSAIEALQAECAEHKENAMRNARIAVSIRAERDALQSKLDTATQSSAHWQHQCTELQAENEKFRLLAKANSEALGAALAERDALQARLNAMNKGEALAPLTDEQCRASFEAWYASAPDAEPEPERTYELTDESMTELTKDCIWLGWQAAHGIHAKGGQHEDA